MIDEASHFTEKMYQILRSRNRATNLTIPECLQGLFPRIILTSNPGNIGHEWLKRYFVDDSEPMEIRQMPKELGYRRRQFIPALLEDNPTLMEQDPFYEYNLQALGSPALVEALRYGNWNITAGAFFPEFGTKHIIDAFEIPDYWYRFRSFDWGSAHPFSVGWWAVSDGTVGKIPKGALIRYREWYGAKSADEGLRLTVEQVAEGILSRETSKENIVYSVADTAIFTEDGGPSMAERFAMKGVYFIKADKSRSAGWDEFRQRLKGVNDVPMVYIFKNCKDFIRTLPLLINDEKRPEDVDTRLEDHIADEARYAFMSRPMIPTKPKDKEPILGLSAVSLDKLYQLNKTYMDDLTHG